MQFLVNLLGQRTADSIRLLQFFNTCGEDAFQPAKPCQQTLPALGSDTINLLQTGAGARFAKFGAMAINCKTVGFIANLLDQMQSRMIFRQL